MASILIAMAFNLVAMASTLLVIVPVFVSDVTSFYWMEVLAGQVCHDDLDHSGQHRTAGHGGHDTFTWNMPSRRVSLSHVRKNASSDARSP